MAKKVDQIDIEGLSSALTFHHLPPHDEIQHVAHAIEQMNTKLHQQITTIKQFVSNVSHEFKTPLMALQSTLEVAKKSKEYTSSLDESLSIVGVMSRLLETMFALSSLDNQELVVTPVDIAETVNQVVSIIQKKYPYPLHIEQHISPGLMLTTHQ